MKRPPLNQLKSADLWNATIVNNGESFTAYLYGSMKNNENDEMIATGQTMTFEVKKGTTNFKVSDLPKIPDVSYLSKDPKYKKSFMNTGGAPPGDYKICCELRRKDNTVSGEDCFDQKITGGDPPQLISPRDEEELRIDNPVFTWMHVKAPNSNQTYTIKIVEIIDEQSSEEAMKRNQAFFEKDGLSQQLFQYPSTASKFESGKKYAWQIKYGDFQSTISIFDRWGNLITAKEISCNDFKFNIVQSNNGYEKRKISPGTREGDTALNKGDEKRKISPGTREGDTALNKGNEKMKISPGTREGDTALNKGNEKMKINPGTRETDTIPDGDEKRKISPGTREGDTALNKGVVEMKISPGTREGDTALNKGDEKTRISIDIKDYDISITNNYSGLLANRPVSFTITTNTQIISASDIPDGWTRTPSKFPPGSSGIKWTNNSGDIPNGLIDLGYIRFDNSKSALINVIYEWLNKDGKVICKDSVEIDNSVSIVNDEHISEPGYTIEFLERGKSIIKIKTDKDGNFTFPDIPDGTYKFKISDTKRKVPEVMMMTIEDIGFIIFHSDARN